MASVSSSLRGLFLDMKKTLVLFVNFSIIRFKIERENTIDELISSSIAIFTESGSLYFSFLFGYFYLSYKSV